MSKWSPNHLLCPSNLFHAFTMVSPNSKIILESTVSLLHYLAFMNIQKNSKYAKKTPRPGTNYII